MDQAEALMLIRGVAAPTPLEMTDLARDREVLLKREDLGPNGAFKWRGALAAVEMLRRDGATAVTTASTGNHGVSVAWAASRLGVDAHVVVPARAVDAKCELIVRHGAELYRVGGTLDEAAEYAVRLAQSLDVPLLEDGASESQLMGTATVGHELREQARLDCVVAPLACGALVGGLAYALKGNPDPPYVVGVQSVHFSRIAARLQSRPYVATGSTTIADGLADDRVVEPAFSFCRRYVDDVVTVGDRQLLLAMRELWDRRGLVVEGAAAAPLAALRAHGSRIPGNRVALIVSGGNLDSDLRKRVVEGDTASGQLDDRSSISDPRTASWP